MQPQWVVTPVKQTNRYHNTVWIILWFILLIFVVKDRLRPGSH